MQEIANRLGFLNMIKRFFIKLFIVIFVIALILYLILFTPYGNDFLKPHVQNRLNNYLNIPVSIDTFMLRHNRFNIDLSSSKGVIFKSSGTFSLFSRDVNGIFTMYVNKIGSGNKHTKNAIKAVAKEDDASNFDLKMESVIKGKLNNFKIITVSKIKNGNLRADFYVIGFRLLKFDIDGEDIDLDSLLVFLKLKPYASGELNIRANVSNNFPKVNGTMIIELTRGELREDLIKEDFGVQVPPMSFNSNLNINFNGKNALHNLKLFSNVGTIESKGTTDIETKNLDASYKIDVRNLSSFTSLLSMPLCGGLQTNGNLKLNHYSNRSFLTIEGNSNFALGDTTYIISLKDYLVLNSLVLKINNVSIGDVLYAIGKPRFIQGRLNADVDLISVFGDTNGSYKHSIDGYIDGAELEKITNINSPNIAIKNNVNTIFTNGKGKLDLNLQSDLGTFSIQNGMVRLRDLYASFLYQINLNNLKNLSFFTPMPLNGDLKLNGSFEYKDSNLNTNFYSSLFNGELKGSYDGSNLVLKMKNMESHSILKMLQYPSFLHSSINATINFNIFKSSGNFNLASSKGYFDDNGFSGLLKNSFKINFVKEMFNDIKANGEIKGNLIEAQMLASSANTNMRFNNVKLDLARNIIDSNWSLNFRGFNLEGKLKGDVNNPKITLDKNKTINSNINNILDSNKIVNDAKNGINKFLNKAK